MEMIKRTMDISAVLSEEIPERDSYGTEPVDELSQRVDVAKFVEQVGPATLEGGVPVKREKVFCHECAFWVVAQGHAERCQKRVETPQRVKDLAWVGDAIWLKIVRCWVVVNNRPLTEVQKYISNASLSELYPMVSSMFHFGVGTRTDASVHTKATFVEAALAISTTFRMLALQHFSMTVAGIHPNDIWRVETLRELHMWMKPQPYFDGYSYLHLMVVEQWSAAVSFGRYPFWRSLIPLFTEDAKVDVYVRVVGGIAHFSNYKLCGMTRYTGRVLSMPLDHSVRVG